MLDFDTLYAQIQDNMATSLKVMDKGGEYRSDIACYIFISHLGYILFGTMEDAFLSPNELPGQTMIIEVDFRKPKEVAQHIRNDIFGYEVLALQVAMEMEVAQ